jgi:hypothetical protein
MTTWSPLALAGFSARVAVLPAFGIASTFDDSEMGAALPLFEGVMMFVGIADCEPATEGLTLGACSLRICGLYVCAATWTN